MDIEKIKILAIDDNQDNLISLKALIKEAFPTALLLTALNGSKGLELAVAEDPDVILLDIVMPIMDGFEVCNKLKADKTLVDIPVVFITAIKGDKASRIRALECGAEAFLSKPIDETELKAQIRAMVKIKTANTDKRDENKRLAEMVHLRTLQLQQELVERMQAELKIREKDVEFRKLSANLPDLIFQFTRRPNGSYCVPIASEGIRNIFGCSPEDVVDDFTPIGRVIHPDDAVRVISDIEYSAKHLTYFTCEFRVQIPGREVQWIFSRSSPEKMSDGSITWYGFNADITDRKKVEQELITAKEHAEESDRLKSAFLANMSHEIRTPMNGILGFAGLLKEPDLTGEEKQAYIKIIEKSGARMLNIINDIVDISKIEAGMTEVNSKESNINEQIEYIYTFFKPEAEAKGIKLLFKNTLLASAATIHTDREKLFAILTNLVKNALKYTDVGSIEFGYYLIPNSAVDDAVEMEFFVKDTGIGIPKDKQALVFERFTQADIEDKMARQGAGLGLSISKAYIEMLGGKIWVESEVGIGSTFHFTLPYLVEA